MTRCNACATDHIVLGFIKDGVVSKRLAISIDVKATALSVRSDRDQ